MAETRAISMDVNSSVCSDPEYAKSLPVTLAGVADHSALNTTQAGVLTSTSHSVTNNSAELLENGLDSIKHIKNGCELKDSPTTTTTTKDTNDVTTNDILKAREGGELSQLSISDDSATETKQELVPYDKGKTDSDNSINGHLQLVPATSDNDSLAVVPLSIADGASTAFAPHGTLHQGIVDLDRKRKRNSNIVARKNTNNCNDTAVALIPNGSEQKYGDLLEAKKHMEVDLKSKLEKNIEKDDPLISALRRCQVKPLKERVTSVTHKIQNVISPNIVKNPDGSRTYKVDVFLGNFTSNILHCVNGMEVAIQGSTEKGPKLTKEIKIEFPKTVDVSRIEISNDDQHVFILAPFFPVENGHNCLTDKPKPALPTPTNGSKDYFTTNENGENIKRLTVPQDADDTGQLSPSRSPVTKSPKIEEHKENVKKLPTSKTLYRSPPHHVTLPPPPALPRSRKDALSPILQSVNGSSPTSPMSSTSGSPIGLTPESGRRRHRRQRPASNSSTGSTLSSSCSSDAGVEDTSPNLTPA